uniref:Centrosome and spindle pole-associated protein 1 n=1 Tax=Macrostomum lignano TaxID=282301 RepID=A0A1I8FVA3_9PLAT
MSRQVLEPMRDIGRISLTHDDTPGRDPYNPTSSQPAIGDARFQGYPTQLMQKPRMPLTVPSSKESQKDDYQQHHQQLKKEESLSQLLNPPISTDRPLGFDRDQPAVPSLKRGKGVNPYLSENEEEKIARQQMEAEADIQRYKQEKQRQMLERQLEKRQDMHMLSNYNPWGRPGHGAPRGVDSEVLKKQKFLEQDVPSDQPEEQGQQAMLREVERQHELKEELQTFETHNPANPFGSYDPWGKGYGTPVRDSEGNVHRYPFHDKRDGSVLYPLDSEAYRVASQQAQAAPGNPYTLPRLTFDGATFRGPQGEHIPPSHRYYGGSGDPYFPFGKPGSGAPIVDSKGNLVPSVYGAIEHEEHVSEKQRKALAARIYSQELQQEMIEQSLSRRLEKQQRRAPVDDFLTEQLARGAVGKPHLPAFVDDAGTYGTDLQRAAEERAALRQLERLQDVQEANQHANTFEGMFGRPGAGAPYQPTNRKANLQEVLHHPDSQRNEYRKAVSHSLPVPSTVFVRNNVNSTHENRYEAAAALASQGESRWAILSFCRCSSDLELHRLIR